MPLDVLKYHVFPYLNYCERNVLNDLTITQYRIPTKIPKDKIAQFEMTLASALLRPMLHKVETLTGQERHETILTIYKTTLPKCVILCRHNAGFREVMVNKLVNYLDPNYSDLGTCTEAFKDEFSIVIPALLELVNSKYQFCYHLTSTIINDKWSFVDAGPPQIIEVWTPYKPEANTNKRSARRRYRDQSSYHYDAKFDSWCEARMEKAKTTKN